ncbi:MAG: site-2 protease family protein [Syntrophobacterales bacterium]|jgi:Zn-dependent protease/predicted transcriptional regulator|nr:site-2 protease family protein [Syntrophobacterales bacterium]
MNGKVVDIEKVKSIGRFKVAGITIGFDYSWFIIFAVVLLALAGGYFPNYYPGYRSQTYWIAGFIATLFFFSSVVIHELAHSLMAIRSGIEIKEITLFIFGGVSRITEEPHDPVTELKVALVGPLSSFALALIFWVVKSFFAGFQLPLLTGIFAYLAWINLALGIFNLIPGFPLDGGRVFRAVVWWYTGSLTRATRVAADLGKGFATALMILGGVQIFLGDLIGGIWFILIGMFLRGMSQRGYEEVVVRKTLENVPVQEIMTREVVTVTAGLSLYDLIHRYFLHYPYRGFPVKDDGRILGLVSLNKVKDIPPGEYPTLAVRDFVTPLSDDTVIAPEVSLDEALKQMIRQEQDRLLVMQQGQLAGIITRHTLTRFVEIKQILEPEKAA